MNLLPPPPAFGLPERFKAWRPDQQQAFQLMLDADQRFIGLTMPTGAGKSLSYMAALRLCSGRGAVLTSTKGLQDQIGEDFSELGLIDLRGMRNYSCKALLPGGEFDYLNLKGKDLEPSCEDGPCHAGAPCTLKEAGCSYYDLVRYAQGKNLVTNYALWLAQRRYSAGLGKVNFLVLDEAHQAIDELAGALTISLEKWMLSAVGVESQPPDAGLQSWKEWARFHAQRLRKKQEGQGTPQSHAEVKYRKRVRAVERVLGAISEMELGNWVADHTDQAYVFEVVNPAAYAEELLFQGAEKVVLLSATLTEKTLRLLGIKDDVLLWECPSRFPVARRPVYYIPTVQVDAKMKPEHWTAWSSRIDQIINPRQDRKGIVHTVSYKRRDYVLATSDHSKRMITHSNQPGEAAKVVQQFKKAQQPVILVSPSMTTGWDFPHDQCRYQIVTKLPFPDMRGAVMKARAEIDKEYMPYLTAQSLVQSVGRGMRAETDWCETFIIDDHWKWFVKSHRKLMPKWFLDAVRQSLTLPLPYKEV